MTFQEITNETNGLAYIVISNEDGSAKSFPADETNPEYIAFLKQLEETAE